MKKSEKEYVNYQEYLEKLDVALSSGKIEKLPKKITPSVITNTLVNIVRFEEIKIKKKKFDELANSLLNDVEYIKSKDFSNKIYNLLKDAYPNKSEDEIRNKIIDVIYGSADKSNRLTYLLSAADEYKNAYNYLYRNDKNEEHNKNMLKINSTRNIEELPRIGLGNVNQRISKNLYDLFNKEQLRTIYTGVISKSLLDGKTIDDPIIKKAIKYLCESKEMVEPYNSMNIDERVNYISQILKDDYELKYLVEEIKEKEKRIKKIYKLDHEDIMDQIEDSNRISEMPSNLSISRITSYLSGNSIIYTKGKTISGGEFIKVADLLLKGSKITDKEVQEELKNIIDKNYEENNEESYKLLKDKLSNLPKLDYYVEEVKVGMQRQQEFISRGSSNVNVYFIPNPKSPMDGGRFYNCYINRASNLNLEEVLPLDLEEIVPPNMDIDAIEWYVRKKADPTFKAAGGIILNKDESIGGVNIFRPNDGKVGITPEEKSKYEKLEELSKKLKEITDKSKKAKEEYMKAQAVIDEEISTIQDAMNVLIEDENEKVLKKQWKNEE